MTAHFAGQCRCGASVMRGDTVKWAKGKGVVECPACAENAKHRRAAVALHAYGRSKGTLPL